MRPTGGGVLSSSLCDGSHCVPGHRLVQHTAAVSSGWRRGGAGLAGADRGPGDGSAVGFPHPVVHDTPALLSLSALCATRV